MRGGGLNRGFTETRLPEHLLQSVRLDPLGWGNPQDLKMTDKLNEGSAFVLQQLRLRVAGRVARMST